MLGWFFIVSWLAFAWLTFLATVSIFWRSPRPPLNVVLSSLAAAPTFLLAGEVSLWLLMSMPSSWSVYEFSGTLLGLLWIPIGFLLVIATAVTAYRVNTPAVAKRVRLAHLVCWLASSLIAVGFAVEV